MKPTSLFILFLCSVLSLKAQNSETNSNDVKRYFYRDSVMSMERWYGHDKKIDSLKTYYKTGELDEVFYFKKTKFHGTSFKFNKTGDIITSWTFKSGKLLNRKDFIVDYNKKNEQEVKGLHVKLKEVKKQINKHPIKLGYRYQLAHIRYKLGNRTLALNEYTKIERVLIRNFKGIDQEIINKKLANIYDAKGSIYASYEKDDTALDYKFKATTADPDNTRLIFNLGAYLYTVQSYRLSKIYLEKALEKWPNHAFTHRILAAYYSDFENYEQAKYHIDIAFSREKNLLKYGDSRLERDIRTLRGFISHNLGDSESGIKDLNEVISLNKNNSFAYRNLGEVHFDLGNYKLACKYLKIAKELGYKKIHDRYDLQPFLEVSCNNASKLSIEDIPKLAEKPFIYPNPTKGKLNVKNINYTSFDYLVFDHSGKLVSQGGSHNKTIDISNLPSGVYVLKVINNNTSETFRVIRE